MYVSLSTFVHAVTSCPLGSLTNTLPDLDHVPVSNQGLLPILKAIHLQSGCESFQTDRKYIQAYSKRKFEDPGYEPTSYSKFNKELDTMVKLTKSYEENCWGKIFHEEITPASGFQVPASRFWVSASRFRVHAPRSGSPPPGLGPRPRVWVPAPGSGSFLQLPASRPSDLSFLRINGNLHLKVTRLGKKESP